MVVYKFTVANGAPDFKLEKVDLQRDAMQKHYPEILDFMDNFNNITSLTVTCENMTLRIRIIEKEL